MKKRHIPKKESVRAMLLFLQCQKQTFESGHNPDEWGSTGESWVPALYQEMPYSHRDRFVQERSFTLLDFVDKMKFPLSILEQLLMELFRQQSAGVHAADGHDGDRTKMPSKGCMSNI